MNGLDMRIEGFGIDKSTAFQTICQIIKYYQTRVWGYMPNHVFDIYEYIGYRGYRGIKGLSKYRRISAISHIETLNVSQGGIGGYKARVYKEIPNTPIGYIQHMRDMRIYGLMV